MIRFPATVQQTGKTTTGIRVPDEVLAALGGSKRPKVVVTLDNGFSYRTTVGSHDGAAFLSVSAAVRAEAGIAGGDEIEVELAIDDAPRVVEIPGDLVAALADDSDAQAFLGGLTASQQQGFADSVTSAKKPETRQRRVDAAVIALRERRKRP